MPKTAKTSYNEKCVRIAKQLPHVQKPAPLLPIMIYVLERGCLAAGKTIPHISRTTSPPVGRPRLVPMRGHGESDLDRTFKRTFGAITSKQIQAKTLDRFAHVVSSYRSLPESTKLLFGPSELITLDPKIVYDSKSFDSYFSPPPAPPAPPGPPPPKVAPTITDLFPTGIPGKYGANKPFAIAGDGFSLTPHHNNIVITQMSEPVSDPDNTQKVPAVESDVLQFLPKSPTTTKLLDATVPSALAPDDKPYLLRVDVSDGPAISSSNKVPFHIVTHPTVIGSPIIETADKTVISGGTLFVTARNVGLAAILENGQDVAVDATTVPVFLEAHLVAIAGGGTVTIRQQAGPSSPIVVTNSTATSPGDVQITLPDDMLPGPYKLQLLARLASSGVSVSNAIVFDDKGGKSTLHDVEIKALKYRVQFTQVTCEKETGEFSLTDEILAAWSCTFDAKIEGRASSEYDMNSGDVTPFRPSDNPLFTGEIGRLLTVSCSLLEIDSGDQAALTETLDKLAGLCLAIAGVLSLAGIESVATLLGAPLAAAALVAAGILAVAAGLAKAISALISAIGNDDDPLGIQLQAFDAKVLRQQTEDGKFLSGLFTFAEDGIYHVNFNIVRI